MLLFELNRLHRLLAPNASDDSSRFLRFSERLRASSVDSNVTATAGRFSSGSTEQFKLCLLFYENYQAIWWVWASALSAHSLARSLYAKLHIQPHAELRKPSNILAHIIYHRFGTLRQCAVQRIFTFMPSQCCNEKPNEMKNYPLKLFHLSAIN